MTLTIDLNPSEEARIEAFAREQGIDAVEVIKRLVNERIPPAPSVRALLTKWQQQYGLPARPDGKIHSSFHELLEQWQEEDAQLSPEEIAAQNRLWDDWKRDQEPVTI